MNTTSTTNPVIAAATPSRAWRAPAALGAALAAVVNTAIWLVGRAADASFLTSPPMLDGDLRVGLPEIVSATVVAFVLGSWVHARAARRSSSAARAVRLTALPFAVLSAGGPLTSAQDTSTGVLLATMHVVTAAVFLVAVSRARGRSRT